MLPDQIERIMPAGPASAVFVYVLVPNKLIGWTEPLSRAQRALLPAKFARLRVIGHLGGANPTATAADVERLHPDLIIGYGLLTPPTIMLADRIQQQTGVPYILLDDSIQQMPEMLRRVGPIVGAGDHGLAVTSYAYHAIEALRGQLLISPATDRPQVYYGRGQRRARNRSPRLASDQQYRSGWRHQCRGRPRARRGHPRHARPNSLLEPADHRRPRAQLL